MDDSARDIDASCRRGAMWRDENGGAEGIAVVGADAHKKVWEGIFQTSQMDPMIKDC